MLLVYDMIDGMFPTLPRLEMFSRAVHPLWDRWGTKLARFEQGAPMGGVSRNSESNYAQRVTGLADDLHRTECLGRGSLRLVIRHTTAQRLYTAFPVRRFISGDE
jgi:hypothetical protein